MIMLDIVTRRWMLARSTAATAKAAPSKSSLTPISETIAAAASSHSQPRGSETVHIASELLRCGPMPQPAQEKMRQSEQQRPRQHSTTRKSAFTSRMTATVQTATVPLRRLVSRVMSRLPRTSTLREEEMKGLHQPRTSERRSSHQDQHRPASFAHSDSLKFCIWRGGEYASCGWMLQRKFLLDESQFVWLVSHVESVAEWERTGLRPGDVLETIGGISVASFTREDEIIALLAVAIPGTVLRFRVRQVLDTCRLDRFHVSARAVRLGVTMIADGSDATPVVFNVADTTQRDGGGGGVAGVRPGDVLCDLDGVSVIGWGIPRVTAMIQACAPDKCLTFQRWTHYRCHASCRLGTAATLVRCRSRQTVGPSSRKWLFTGAEFHDDDDDDAETQDVVIVWKGGPLGLTLVKDGKTKMPKVNRLTGKGTTPSIVRIQHGYHLVSVNGVPTHPCRFTQLVKDLAQMKKPARLVFRPPPEEVAKLLLRRRRSRQEDRLARMCRSSSLMSLDRYTTTVG